MATDGTAVFRFTTANTKKATYSKNKTIALTLTTVTGFPSDLDFDNDMYSITDITADISAFSMVYAYGCILYVGDYLGVDLYQNPDAKEYSSYAARSGFNVIAGRSSFPKWLKTATGATLHIHPNGSPGSNVITLGPKTTITFYVSYRYKYSSRSASSSLQIISPGEVVNLSRSISGDRAHDRRYVSYSIYDNSLVAVSPSTPRSVDLLMEAGVSSTQIVIPTRWGDFFPTSFESSGMPVLRNEEIYDMESILYEKDDMTPNKQLLQTPDSAILTRKPILMLSQRLRVRIHPETNAPTITGISYERVSQKPLFLTHNMDVTGFTGYSIAVSGMSAPANNFKDYVVCVYRKAGGDGILSEVLDIQDEANGWDVTPEGTGYARVYRAAFTTEAFEIADFDFSGQLFWVVFAEDSRGLCSHARGFETNFHAYTVPEIMTSAFRSSSLGNAQGDGTYLTVQGSAVFDPLLDGNNIAVNQPTLSVVSRDLSAVTTTTITDNILQTNYPSTVSGLVGKQGTVTVGAASGNSAYQTHNYYEITFTYTDYVYSFTRQIRIPSAEYTLHFRPGGTGIGIGRACTKDNAIEINPSFKVCLGAGEWIRYSDATPTTNLVTGTIWLQPV